ncbi:DUF2255 family protein [Amycolatopsis rhabdoformis]|uniref:DUF2255 family protein n=1 Tax=Amycolatopsis rhabdoformis TaxID=1448059 RepID=A0ABZ1IGP3_9PSEU|nr:DUF2255 family protein [Amycolatopsis rhabdoformis]WSE33261.1 DUF2255 family protein [Amycolatopsis rhabdoformis]
MTAWSAEDLAVLTAEAALSLTAGTEGSAWVEVGFVVVDDLVFVRAFRGPGSRWFQAAHASRRGRIRVGSLDRAVAFAPDTEHSASVDGAYQARYSAASLVTNAQAHAATLRITPL